MLDPIGETNVRTMVRPETNILTNAKEIQTDQEQKLRELRSIEKSESESEVKEERENKEKQQTAKYRQEEDTIVYEKYNKNGELIFRMPPKQKPLDELA